MYESYEECYVLKKEVNGHVFQINDNNRVFIPVPLIVSRNISAFGPELAYRLCIVAQPTLMDVTSYFWYTIIYWAPKETIHSIYLKLFYSKNETLTFIGRNVILGV